MIRDLFKIFLSLRWPNLIITGFTLYISYYLLLLPAFEKAGIQATLSYLHFIIIIISMMFIMAGGYIINDWMDAESDAANQKSGLIPFIPRRTILFSYALSNLTGLFLALFICIEIGNFQLLSIPVAVIGLLLFYSTTLKSTPLAGNLLIAILSGVIPILPMVIDKGFAVFHLEFDNTAIYFLAILGFIVSLIRELVKDMEDEVGDRKSNLLTFPVLFGLEAAKWTAFIFSLLFLLLLVLMLSILLESRLYASIYLIIFIILPNIYLTFKLSRAESKKDFHFISNGLKLIMLSGLIFAIVYYFSYL